jgi:hypothetical protein
MNPTIKLRIEQLKAMHNFMLTANYEPIYYEWIMMIPDNPSEEDFLDIAVDDEFYKDCCELFAELVQKVKKWSY